jgi:predicted Zn finger-like uncharacterized protein
MSLSVVCPSCSVTLNVKEEISGKRVRCPTCSKVFVVPPPDTPTQHEIMRPNGQKFCIECGNVIHARAAI